MMSPNVMMALKNLFLGLLVAGFGYALLGSPPGAVSKILIGGKYAKIVHSLIVGLLAVLANVLISYM